MIVTAIQVNLGLISLAESEVTKRLGSFAALFAVPTMIAGIHGMNSHRIPELDWVYGYPAVICVMLAGDICLYWRFRKADGLMGTAGMRLDGGKRLNGNHGYR